MLCGAEMSRRKMSLALACEVNGEENVSSQWCLWVHDIIWGRKQYGTYNNLVQELWLDVTRFAAYFRLDKSFVLISYNSLCSKTSTIIYRHLLHFFLLLWKRKVSLFACHWSAIKKALDVGRYFFRKVESWKRFWAAEKKHWRWRLKNAQKLFFLNTVYTIEL